MRENKQTLRSESTCDIAQTGKEGKKEGKLFFIIFPAQQRSSIHFSLLLFLV